MNLTNSYPSLVDTVVLITGGATGIGAGLVEAFCQQRARVVFVDILQNEAERLVEKIAAIEGAVAPVFFQCDLLDIAALQSVIARIRNELGPIAVLINN
ncbi:MAG: SDR family NAD(P)-dependent oxidoreductase, partial [Moraxellaceae bacterium]